MSLPYDPAPWSGVIVGIVIATSVFASFCVAWAVLRTRRRDYRRGSFSTRRIVSVLLIFFGIVTFVESLLWWNIYGSQPDGDFISFAGFALSILFFLASTLVSKGWRQKNGV